MPRAYIGIGTNLGDRQAHLALARLWLAQLPDTTLLAMSRAYETEPVGPVRQGRFLNAAVALETRLQPHDLMEQLQAIEQRAGRISPEYRLSWGPRPLDLDLLLYNGHILRGQTLTLPHPHLHERRFALEPLVEIAPDLMHPTLGRTMRDLLDAIDHER